MMVFPLDSQPPTAARFRARFSSGEHWFCLALHDVTLNVPVRVEPQVSDDLPGLGVLRGQRQGGHLFFDAVVDVHGHAVKTRMMLDPGATICVLPEKLYRLGNAQDASQLQTLSFDTANGRIECSVDELDVTIGAVKRRCRVAITADDSAALLGAEFLGDAPYSVDVANEYVVLSPGVGGLVSSSDEQWLPQQVSGESWTLDPLEVQAREAQLIATTMARVDMEGAGWWTRDARLHEAQSKFALAVMTHLASAGHVGLARHYYRQRRTVLRMEERVLIPDSILRADAATVKQPDAPTAGVPKATLTPITYEELLERADNHLTMVLELPGIDKKSPQEIGDLVADRCRDDIDAHMLLASKNRPTDSKLSLTEWDAEMRATLRRLVSSMSAAIVSGVREFQSK